MRTIYLILAIFILSSCVQPQVSLPDYSNVLTDKERKIQNQMFADSWLNTYVSLSEIGTSILFNASDLCLEEDRIYSLGMNLANEHSAYEMIRGEINESLNLGSKLKVVSMGDSSPAFKAGIFKGDEILEIDNNEITQGIGAYDSYVRMIDRDNIDTYRIKVLRNEEIKTIKVQSEQRCRFNFFIDLDNDTFNAFANGEYIVFSLRMAKWLLMDDIGAAIVFAHELAHNANHHVRAKTQNASAGALVGLLFGLYVGFPGDMMEIGQSIGATSFSIEYENEADYLSMYILAQSGYDLDKAVNFWRKFAIEVPGSIYSSGGTHPSTAERYVRMESTIKEIREKIKNGDKLVPNY